MAGPFKLKSGNSTPFKLMGSSPLHQEFKKERKELKKKFIGPTKPMIDKNKNKIPDVVESRESLEGKLPKKNKQIEPTPKRNTRRKTEPKSSKPKNPDKVERTLKDKLKGHPVTPPTAKQSKKSKGTLKGRTGFEYDVVDPIKGKIRQGLNLLKTNVISKGQQKINEAILKGVKKGKGYFTKN